MFTRARSAGPVRRLGAGLILLALWLPLLTPAAGALTRARQAGAAAADAVTHAVICGADESPVPAADPPSERTPCDRCPFCRCTAVAPLPPPPVAIVAHLVWRRVAWPIPPPSRGARPPRAPVQARAPPETV